MKSSVTMRAVLLLDPRGSYLTSRFFVSQRGGLDVTRTVFVTPYFDG